MPGVRGGWSRVRAPKGRWAVAMGEVKTASAVERNPWLSSVISSSSPRKGRRRSPLPSPLRGSTEMTHTHPRVPIAFGNLHPRLHPCAPLGRRNHPLPHGRGSCRSTGSVRERIGLACASAWFGGGGRQNGRRGGRPLLVEVSTGKMPVLPGKILVTPPCRRRGRRPRAASVAPTPALRPCRRRATVRAALLPASRSRG